MKKNIFLLLITSLLLTFMSCSNNNVDEEKLINFFYDYYENLSLNWAKDETLFSPEMADYLHYAFFDDHYRLTGNEIFIYDNIEITNIHKATLRDFFEDDVYYNKKYYGKNIFKIDFKLNVIDVLNPQVNRNDFEQLKNYKVWINYENSRFYVTATHYGDLLINKKDLELLKKRL